MSDRTFAIKVYGCQMNVYDGDRLRSAMTALGWRETSEIESADCAIFVTCSIRDKAEQKVVSELGRFRATWEKSHKPRVALLGCMAQRMGETVAKKFPWVTVVAGPRHLGAVPGAISESFEKNENIFLLDEDPNALDDLSCAPTPSGNPHKAYVTIAHGCDQFCSYCIVPYVRGRFGSRKPDTILGEIEALVHGGVLEITLLGQNVNTYGKDIGYRFADLLTNAASIPGLRRLRFVTSHPIDFTDDILEAMTSRPNICPGINLPVQAGSDKVLKEMNRKYTRTQYLATVSRIREALPSCGLTTDLIVGFPGETTSEFEESVSLLREVCFDLVHTAAYSPREGTPAAQRTDQVLGRERARRLNEVNAIQADISSEINRALVGQTFEVLLDEPAQKGEGLLQGRTTTDKVVLVASGAEQIGTFQNVRITGSSAWCLEGEIL
ncbi:tRNA (N6-isopentenyl adenosine(37)-C2)-methylthiotransferase MiaB [Synergistaceae bacterium OttesenSCG-928-I11]|nr:tRNA (N6-isopentenyl adenosine(37)-C2)-methylthiotransferase MiaB [Synergistaceae bacterium OttesenSCG-928-I11]